MPFAGALIDDVAAVDGRDVSVMRGYRFCSTDLAGGVQLNELSGSKRDDAADRVVWGYTNGDPISGNDLDSEASHPAAQLR